MLRAVDRLAKEAAQGPLRIDYGYSGGTFARRKSGGPRRAAPLHPFTLPGQTAAIRAYRTKTKKVAGRREHKVFFELYLPEQRQYSAAFYAYLDDDGAWHRNHCYRARFNESPTYPKIAELHLLECPSE